MDQVLIGNVDQVGPKNLPNKKLSLSCPLISLMERHGFLFGFSKSLRAPYAVRVSRLTLALCACVLVWFGKKHMKKEEPHLFFVGILLLYENRYLFLF